MKPPLPSELLGMPLPEAEGTKQVRSTLKPIMKIMNREREYVSTYQRRRGQKGMESTEKELLASHCSGDGAGGQEQELEPAGGAGGRGLL